MSKYSSLMDYLDAQDTDSYTENNTARRDERDTKRPLPSPPPPQYSNSKLSVSTMNSPSVRSYTTSSPSFPPSSALSSAHSPASSSAPSSASRKQYIWDEVESERQPERPNGRRDLTKTYVNPSANTSNSATNGISNGISNGVYNTGDNSVNRRRQEEPPDYESNEHSSSKEQSSVNDMIATVKNKVDNMKVELKDRTETVRELQSELARLRKAKERKGEKCERIWQTRVNDLKEEQNKMLRRQNEFYDKISEDTKNLNEKDMALRDKNESFENNAESSMQRMFLEGQKRIEKASQQWIADEKVSFDKILLTKIECMRTRAAKLIGVKMDSTALEYRESVQRQAENTENKIIQLKTNLIKELQMKFMEATEKINEEKNNEFDRQKKIDDRRMEEIKRRHENEVFLFKEKVLRTKNVLQETLERSKNDDMIMIRKNMKKVKDDGNKLYQDCLEAYQRNLGSILREYSERKNGVELKAREDNIAYEKVYRKELRDQQLIMKKKAREVTAAKTIAETERIISRLRKEAEEERMKIQDTLQNELDSMRDKAQIAIDTMKHAEISAADQVSTLRADVASLSCQLEPLRDKETMASRDLSEGRKQLETLRIDLKEMEERILTSENEYQQLEITIHNEKNGHTNIIELEMKIEDMKESIKSNTLNRTTLQKEAETAHEDELHRIQQKVITLLEKKGTAVENLKFILEELQKDSDQLEGTLELLRLQEN